MRNNCFGYTLLLVLFILSGYRGATQLEQQPVKQIKLISYNILDGYNRGKDTARQRSAAEWIASQHPDVVAFQELCGFTEDKLKAFAKNWGHEYSVILKENGYPVGLTSNRPIEVKMKMRDSLWHGMLHAFTYGIDFLVVHLSPSDYKTRQREAKLITRYMENTLSKEDGKYIVLGDYNAHSPFDAFMDKQRSMLLARYQQSDSIRKSNNLQNLVHREFDYSVISCFLGFPLIDVCERKMKEADRFSYPTPILIGTYRKPGEVVPTHERIDYMLVSPTLAERCNKAIIINSGVVDKLSDHYPVIAEFDL